MLIIGPNQLEAACFNAFELAAIYTQRTLESQVMDSMIGQLDRWQNTW